MTETQAPTASKTHRKMFQVSGTMKKSTRATLAGVAGLSLLAGGATFALWSEEESIPETPITSGTLTLTETEAGQWVDNNTQANVEMASYDVVPGSELAYTATYAIGASGENLSATLSASGFAPTGDTALAAATTVDADFLLNGVAIDGDVITEANEGDVVEVTVLVTVDEGMTAGQGETVTLSSGSVTLQQTAVAPPV